MPGPGPRLSMSVKMEKHDDTGGRVGSGGESVGRLDAQLWHACAGGMVQLPAVGTKVIYFPQGHGEQAATTPDFPPSLGPSGTVPCRVVSVNFLADTETDEVFARMRLQPEGLPFSSDRMEDFPLSPPPEKPASFAKTLTQSDANNGGGFSVPRYCAETIFPPLDYSSDPPVQTVLAKDVHGDVWKFRHIYRGTPRRHLLTTGWSTFVNQKKLVAGDAIVFLRSASGELCVGVRRSMRGTSGGDTSTWHSSASATSAMRASRWEVKGTESFSDFFGGMGGGGGGGDNGHGHGGGLSSSNGIRLGSQGSSGTSSSSSFARNRARVTAKSVLEAASLAVAVKPFEVVYYPRASTAEFCVKAALVKQALDHSWYAGMRFKMAFETEDSSRISWFMGTIAAVQPADPLLWPNSPWRVLQVTWDEPDLLQGVSRVSPWQVELVATLPMQLPPFSLPKKKLRAVQPQELLQAPPGLLGLPLAGSTSGAGGGNSSSTTFAGQQLPAPWGGPALLDDVSAGMQGARHDRFNGLLTMDFRTSSNNNSSYKHPREYPSDNYYNEQVPPVRALLSDSPPNHHFSLLPNGHHQRQHHHQHHQHHRSQHSVTSFLPAAAAAAANPQQRDNTATAVATKTSTSFFLFGQSIDPSCPSKPQQQQQQCVASGNSSSDGPVLHDGLRVSTTSNSSSENTLENTLENRVRGFANGAVSRYRHNNDASNNSSGHWSDLSIGSGGEVGSLKWFRDQASDREKAGLNEAFHHCKVFREGEEVGRTLDLSIFRSYDEIYDRLGDMFSVPILDFKNRLVYENAEGSTRHVGVEPYRSFVTAVRRLTILPEASNGSAVRS